MSERPNTANPGRSRPRWPWRRFRDLPIWSKLGVIMIVPTLATIVVGTSGLITHIDTASSADRVRVTANVSEAAGELIHQLQDERVAAVTLLGAGEDDANERAASYTGIQQAVDEAERGFQGQSDTLTDVPTSYQELLSTIYSQLSRLPETRNQVGGGGIGIIAATAFYQDTIANLISLRDLSAQLAAETTDTALSDRMRAAVAVSQAKEFLSQRRVVGQVVLIRGAYNPYTRTAYIGAEAGHEQALQVFNVVATGDDLALMDGALQGPEARQSLIYQGNLNSLDSGSLRTLPWDAAAWDEALSAHSDQMRAVESQLDGQVVGQAADLRDEVTQQVLVQAGALLGVLLLAILLAWLVARSMVRSLRDLRQGALSVAQYGLPQAVARLRDPSLSTQLSPDQVAEQIAEPLPVRTRDEFGQVAEAFNVVHMEAVRTAAEQAQLRSSVSAMFVNLARRSQILVDRLISQLDRLERGEEDPDRLADLFQLDHLATRMRRTDENLLVLAGADSTRVQRDPAPMIDVLRAAQSEVEQYTRIEFGVVDRDLEVAAHAVNDLVHLVAELLDNATVFSPPDSHVMVEARRVGDRAVLYVQDRGLGVSRDQLTEINERLATPPLVDVAVSRMMGLVVVSRLAARHGVKVELRPAPSRGTIADVTLPSSVLVPRALAGQPEPPSVRLERLRPEPATGSQLALESGPSTSQPAGRPEADRATSAGAMGYRALADEPGFTPPPPPFAPAPSFVPPQLPASPNAGRTPGGPGYDQPPPTRGGTRSLPKWSDLVGASGPTGHNGSDLTPSGPGAGTGPGVGFGPGTGMGPGTPPPGSPPLPRRRPDQSPSPGDLDRSSGPATDPVGFIAGPPPGQKPPPLPSRLAPRPPTSGPPAIDSPIPRQRPSSVPPGAEIPAAAAPPPWPPVAPTSPGPGGETAPPVLAGTAEPADPTRRTNGGSPDGRRDPGSAVAGRTAEAPQPYTPPPPPPPPPVGDQTMELPIFRELESVWFRTKQPAKGEPGPGGGSQSTQSPTGEPTEFAAVPATSLASLERTDTPTALTTPQSPPSSGPSLERAGAQTGTTAPGATTAPEAGAGADPAATGEVPRPAAGSGAAVTDGPATDEGWRTAADEGWRAASTAAQAPVAEMTPAGLPKRRPMAQLVPGGVETQAPEMPTSQRRSPEAVRGLLSAYHRGVQRGRGQTTDDEMGGSGGSQSRQAGKEQT